jgi:PAS domain S-box-containing protein
VIVNARLYQKQQAMTEQLRRSEANYRELFQNASDAIWIHDLEGRLLETNEAVEKLTGYMAAELSGKNVSDFLTPGALDLAKDVKGKLLTGGKIERRYEQRITRRDGSEAIIELVTRLITDGDGKPVGFHNIARDVTDERKMRENLRFYVKGLLMAQEEERSRVSRELHDDVAQLLLLLGRKLDALISDPPGKLSGPVKEAITEAYELAVRIYSDLQAYARSLRPDILDHLGLKSALEWLVEDLTRDNGIETNTEIHESACNLSPEIELVLFRITQEALNNVKKHAQATSVSVKLQCEGNNVTLTIADNGKGFEVPLRLSDKVTTGKLGLAGMEERARLIGGTLCIRSKAGEGTVVVAKLPQVMISPVSIIK